MQSSPFSIEANVSYPPFFRQSSVALGLTHSGAGQLQKMGILPTPEVAQKSTSTAAKRKSQQTDFSKLGPLKAGGTVGFSAFRDQTLSPNRYSRNKKSGSADSDDEDDDKSDLSGKLDDVDPRSEDKDLLSPEDAKRQGELADGLRKIKACNHHPVAYRS